MSEQPPKGWEVQKNPASLKRRYDFAAYAQTRSFLDLLTQLSESTGCYPDLNFAKTHVNVSVAANEETLGSAEYSFAEQVDALAERASAPSVD